MLSLVARSGGLAARSLRSFSVARPVWKEDSTEVAVEETAVVEATSVDKENPLYAPDSFQPWRNAGYSNLAPAGWKEWEDLPAPYKYYGVKVDPKDVEEPGALYKLFTKWQTGLPMVTLLALPAFVYDVVIIDERFELMLIFWTTMAVFNSNAGDGLKKMFGEQVDAIKSELTTAEAKFETAVETAIDTHKKAMHVPAYLQMINEGERALKAVETEAASRAIAVEQRDRMEAMLDYLVMVRESRDLAVSEEVTHTARMAVESLLSSDAKLQQATIDNAITALGKSATTDSVIEDTYAKAFSEASAEAQKRLAATSGATSNDRDLFARRFGLSTTVTEDMLAKAESDPAAMAVLTAQVGATPSVGAKITQKMAIDY